MFLIIYFLRFIKNIKKSNDVLYSISKNSNYKKNNDVIYQEKDIFKLSFKKK
jgi:hypothetical protein